MDHNDIQGFISLLFGNVSKVILGKDEQIRQALCCWFAGGHILIEDVPGTGKTILARAIAKSAAVDFKRVQFTPDLLPSDILGSAIFNQQKNVFEFLKGPLFTTLFLADEINRATPRTQSALLESMAENQITAEGNTWQLNPLFFVLATQNPVEQHGTFPLPEAQLDRFMMRISIGYPQLDEEIQIFTNQNELHPIHSLKPVIHEEAIRQIRRAVPRIQVHDQVSQYAAKIVHATRRSKDLKLGASPRATIALLRASQARALMEGLDYVKPTHIFHLARSVISHRLILTPEARLSGKTTDQVLEGILHEMKAPID